MGERVPGIIGLDDYGVCRVDDGTSVRNTSVRPGPTGRSPNIAGMSLEDRFTLVLHLTTPKLPGEIQEEFRNMLTPSNIAIMVVVLAAWAGSHYFGVGFIADAVLLIGGVALLGWQIVSAGQDFVDAITITYNARTHRDLDAAATHLANFIAVVGVAVLMALLLKGVKGAKGAKGKPPGNKTTGAAAGSAVVGGATGAATRAGMTFKHFEAFLRVADDMKQVIAVRFTNPNSLQWIKKGFPAKPMEIKIKTNSQTGIVTATNADEIAKARQAGYMVVDPDGVARGPFGRTADLRGKTEWPVEPGQVVHPEHGKPLVGDYDLLSVIDPTAPGRNIALATNRGEAVANRTNPIIDRVRRAVNDLIGEERVMHGAHDSFGDLKSAASKPGDGSIVFMPDNKYMLLETLEDIENFYRAIGRQTIRGKYNAVTPGGYSPTP